MKLLKGFFAIALISMIAVSCTGEKKDADATKENVEVVADADGVDTKMAAHVCDENCKEGNCPMHAKGEHKCSDAKCGDADCTGEGCEKCAAKLAECKAKCAKHADTEKNKEEPKE